MKKEIDTIGSEGCPCGEYNDGETYISAHCWRTSGQFNGKKCKCPFAGVHYKGSRETALKIAKEIKENYGCEVKVSKIPTTP